MTYRTSKRYESFPLPSIGLCLAIVVKGGVHLGNIDWAHRAPIADREVARITLEWRFTLGQPDSQRLRRVIIDRRQNTFVTALSAIGGLLATVQGIHLLLFGRPLWWGLFGACKILGKFAA